MNPFNPAATCPQCSHNIVRAIYQAKGCPPISRCGVRRNGGEHIDRTCQRCFFEWAESVVPPPGRGGDGHGDGRG